MMPGWSQLLTLQIPEWRTVRFSAELTDPVPVIAA